MGEAAATSADGRGAPPEIDVADPALGRLLDRAVQKAVAVAADADGSSKGGAADVPAAVRPIVGHRRLSERARATVRRALHDDDRFRARVAAALGDGGAAEVGEAGELFLLRPPGWQEDLARLVDDARREQRAAGEALEERRAARRLKAVEERASALEAAAAAARAEAEAARADAQEARRIAREAIAEQDRLVTGLRASEERAAAAAHRADGLAVEADAARRASDAAVAARDQALAELAGVRAELAEVRADLAEARAGLVEPEPMRPGEEQPGAPAAVPGAESGRTGDHGGEPDDVAGAVAAAAVAAASLAAALQRAAAALAEEHDEQVEAAAGGEGDARSPALTRRRRTSPRLPRRRPVALPPLVLEGSPEEADHLVRLAGVTVLVDGYNATLRTWPDLPLVEQRRRIVDLMAGVAARFGCRIEVVFDGAEVVDVPIPAGGRSLVRVDFTPSDVEADEVLIERARQRPQPVVVVSDDRRVREGARRGGANVLTVGQLLGAARRG